MKDDKITSRTASCVATLRVPSSTILPEKSRRSSDFHRTIWGSHDIEFIHNPYEGCELNTRVEQLKHIVRQLIEESCAPLAKLELVDSIQRLGVAYHFDKEIADVLQQLYNDGFEPLQSLKETALCFRLLRDHGHYVPSDVFMKFKLEGEFMNSLSKDVEGLLSLYEATHLANPGEKILDEAKEFSLNHLKSLNECTNLNLVNQVKHSLQAPLHWMMPRLEVRHYIDVYEKEEGMVACLLELAKLDFNVIQLLHQKEIKELARWWEDLGFVQNISFCARDRLFESYLWANATFHEPQFSKCRKLLTMLISVAIVIDDFYDTYGSLEEAEMFTIAARRWDPEAIEDFPHNMKLCYLVFYNLVNGMSYEIFKDFGWDVSRIMKRESISLCEGYLKEAQWFHNEITPSFEEYMGNAWTTIGNRFLSVLVYYYTGQKLTEESMDGLEKGYQLIYLASYLVRLLDDLAPSKAESERGQIPLAVKCHMKEGSNSYEDAKEFVKELIDEKWKDLNREALSSHLPRTYINAVINTVRTVYTFFKEEDDSFGTADGTTKDYIKKLFFEPITL